ncbi:hypothetical protein BDF14DRAFT_1155995 [Spinellus fusiger]|nr:hypothetical protein BDF14DRAFT_1155995 [Spinellus fusiger]
MQPTHTGTTTSNSNSSSSPWRHQRYHNQGLPWTAAENGLWASKEACHSRAEKTVEQWGDCLKWMLKYTDTHEEVQRTAKAFVQADFHCKTTLQALERANKTMTLVMEKQKGVHAVLTALEQVEEILDT